MSCVKAFKMQGITNAEDMTELSYIPPPGTRAFEVVTRGLNMSREEFAMKHRIAMTEQMMELPYVPPAETRAAAIVNRGL